MIESDYIFRYVITQYVYLLSTISAGYWEMYPHQMREKLRETKIWDSGNWESKRQEEAKGIPRVRVRSHRTQVQRRKKHVCRNEENDRSPKAFCILRRVYDSHREFRNNLAIST